MKTLMVLGALSLTLAGCDFDPEAMAGGESREDYPSYESISSYSCRARMEKTQVSGRDCHFTPDLEDVIFVESLDGRSVRLTFSAYMGSGVPKLSSLIYKFQGYEPTVSADCPLAESGEHGNSYTCSLPYSYGYSGYGSKARVVSINLEIGECRAQYERRLPTFYNEDECAAEYADTYVGVFSDVQFPRLEGN